MAIGYTKPLEILSMLILSMLYVVAHGIALVNGFIILLELKNSCAQH